MRALWLIPAFAAAVLAVGIPEALEVRRGNWILKGFPGAECVEAMKHERITHVISICRDGDAGFDANEENRIMADAGILFSRVGLKRAPTADDFELFRMVRNSLPANARVVVHCTDGNRAAAVLVAWLAAEGRVKPGEAVALAKQSGMVHPETEQALVDYLKAVPPRTGR